MIQNCSFKHYLSIFHESVVVNLLESILYHKTAIDASGDYLLELVDYAYRAIKKLVSGEAKWVESSFDPKEQLSLSKEQEFERQSSNISFQVAVSCISIVRYLTDNVKTLPAAILRHIHLENDILMACVVLIEERPWLRKDGKTGEREIFEDGQWKKVEKKDYSKLPKLEGQVWITVYNMLLSPECAKEYEITDYRKNMLLRLRKYLNEIILDQIPNLSELARTLDQLSIMATNAQPTGNPFVVQQIPELRRKIAEGKNWQEIAEYQLASYFNSEAENGEFDLIAKFADMYSGQTAEMLAEGFKCANCFKPATQRCSRCKSVWYCSRECQIDHYKKGHKGACKILAEKLLEKSSNIKLTKEDRDNRSTAEVDKPIKAENSSPVEVKLPGDKPTPTSYSNTNQNGTKAKLKVEVLSTTESGNDKNTTSEPAPPQEEEKQEQSITNKMEELD